MRLRTKGYITVFLSLSITIIMSLVLALYQGARIGAARMKTECVMDIAMNSVLAEYSRELFDQYGLLMVDYSYGSGNHSILNAQEHLQYYAQKNFDRSLKGGILNAQTMTAMDCKEAKITGYSVATDGDGAVLKRQILAYMAAEPIGALMTDVLDNVSVLESNDLDTTDVEAMAQENQQTLDEAELPTIVDEDGHEEKMSIGNPADVVNANKGIGIVNLAIKDRTAISGAFTDTSVLASGRALEKGTGLDDKEDISVTEKLLLDQYYSEVCGSYGHEVEKSLLKYQLEYLIYGQNSDYANLEKMAENLLFWREASNMIYLFGCSEKTAQAEAIADVLSIITFLPELKDPIKYSILFAWTFAESVSDLNILFSGGRVPLLKSDATWQLGLTDMFMFRDHLGEKDCGEGLYYSDYLRMRLFMASEDTKLKHMMDVIEMDIRQTKGNSDFRLDSCLDVFRAEMTVSTNYGYEAKIERVYGYEE